MWRDMVGREGDTGGGLGLEDMFRSDEVRKHFRDRPLDSSLFALSVVVDL